HQAAGARLRRRPALAAGSAEGAPGLDGSGRIGALTLDVVLLRQRELTRASSERSLADRLAPRRREITTPARCRALWQSRGRLRRAYGGLGQHLDLARNLFLFRAAK